MECHTTTKGTECTITYSGSMGIAQASEMKTSLMHSSSSCTRVSLDIKAAEGLDMSIVQLLCAANMSFEKKGKTLSIADKDAERISSLLTELGYEKNFVCSESPCNTCLWKGEQI